MQIMIITGSPNQDGLTAACGEQGRLGAIAAGAEVTVVRLNELSIGTCHACGEGWGLCREQHQCQIEDDFQKLHASFQTFDGFVLITPVYWSDMSESIKAFSDRLRRCEALKQDDLYISGKPVICVAAAGGSGNGCISCLANMERFVDHLKGIKFDFIAVTRRSREYKLRTIYEAVKRMTGSIRER
jgi:multimeric flavodoxin WrbA